MLAPAAVNERAEMVADVLALRDVGEVLALRLVHPLQESLRVVLHHCMDHRGQADDIAKLAALNKQQLSLGDRLQRAEVYPRGGPEHRLRDPVLVRFDQLRVLLAAPILPHVLQLANHNEVDVRCRLAGEEEPVSPRQVPPADGLDGEPLHCHVRYVVQVVEKRVHNHVRNGARALELVQKLLGQKLEELWLRHAGLLPLPCMLQVPLDADVQGRRNRMLLQVSPEGPELLRMVLRHTAEL
mmetsp:Transcript_121432/g.377953  ORF Transcript_121432/g.377953 Transcript_121432/m.377953 type:complete len:241 (+) Transcript_121432:288-1010(+)